MWCPNKVAHNGTHWRWQGIQCTFSPEPKFNKELKVQNMYKSPLMFFQPEPQPNSEQKADGMHVSPAIANALVGRSKGKVLQFNFAAPLE